MKFDNYKTLIREQSPYPGSIGDSCFDSSGFQHLCNLLEKDANVTSYQRVSLDAFVTQDGFVRHPTAPAIDAEGDSWREEDFTTDQGLPLFLAADKDLKELMLSRIKKAGWKTGNGDFVSPVFYALLNNKQWLINLCTLGQIALFYLPWRWNDEKKEIEKSEDASGDYINFFHASMYSSKWIRKLVPKEKLKAKISAYYKPEPNCDWLINLYHVTIDKLW